MFLNLNWQPLRSMKLKGNKNDKKIAQYYSHRGAEGDWQSQSRPQMAWELAAQFGKVDGAPCWKAFCCWSCLLR